MRLFHSIVEWFLAVWAVLRADPHPSVGRAPREGKWLRFVPSGTRAHLPAWEIRSQRGGFSMGVVEWSPQWRAYTVFNLAPDLRWNAGSIAELYAFLKERGTETGRFV